MGEILFLSLFLIGSIYLFLLTGDFRLSKMDTSGGAALFPRIVIIFLCLFLVIRIIQALCEKEKSRLPSGSCGREAAVSLFCPWWDMCCF